MIAQRIDMSLDYSVFTPKEVVDLKGHGIKCSEWRQGKDNGPNFKHFGRDLMTEHFHYKIFGVQILVWDVLSGSLKRFLPAKPESVVRIRTLLSITDDRLFVLYERISCERRISILSLDWNEEKYEFIGNSCRLFSSHEAHILRWWTWIGNVSNNIFGVKLYDCSITDPIPSEIRDDTLYLWKVNDSASNLDLHKTIVVPKYARFFKMVDEKLVFMLSKYKDGNRIYGLDQIESVVLLEEDGTMTTLDNTEIYLNYLHCRRPSIGGLNVTVYGTEKWCGDRFFSLHSILYHDCHERSIITNFCLFSFDLNHCKWIQIRLNVPSFDKGFFSFSVDNGFLNILHFVQSWDRKIRVLETDVAYHRFPLGKPEMLQQLAWSKFREYKPKKASDSLAKIFLCELTTNIASQFCSIS